MARTDSAYASAHSDAGPLTWSSGTCPLTSSRGERITARRGRIARIGAFVLAAGLVTALAGCSSTADDTAPTAADTASELSGELTVYAAASLQPAFEELGDAFAEQHPDVSFNFSFDGSSVLATQILSGAPVDVFASADEPNMEKVTDEDMTDGEPLTFATSELAIAVAPSNPFGVETLADLAEPGPDGDAPVTVICAEEVPCGNASRALLERDGVDLAPASEEQNVTAVLTKVSEGEADAGLVYYSDILRAEGDVEGIAIENAEEAAGAYMIAPIDGAASPETAAAFVEFMGSDEAQALFEELGFGPAR